MRPTVTTTNALSDQVVLRVARPGDEAILQRLAALDSRPMPAAPVLVAEVDGEALAALSLADGAAVADPFSPTAPLVELLRAGAAARRGRSPRRFGLHRLVPAGVRTA
jgi:hypothetical protein